jgi:hypothetical protein
MSRGGFNNIQGFVGAGLDNTLRLCPESVCKTCPLQHVMNVLIGVRLEFRHCKPLRVWGAGFSKILVMPRPVLAKPAPTDSFYDLPQPNPHRRYHH